MSTDKHDVKPVEPVSSEGVTGGRGCVFWGTEEEGLHVTSNTIIFISFTKAMISVHRDGLIAFKTVFYKHHL